MNPLPLLSEPWRRLSARFSFAAGAAAVLLTLCSGGRSEETFRLWGDQPAPGLRHEKPEVVNDTRRDPTAPNRSYSLVSEPTLTVFPVADRVQPGPCVLVLPGGGYRTVVFDKEGTEIARWLNSLGISAAVLKYRTRDPDQADRKPVLEASLADAQKAMRVLRSRASEWKINPSQIGAMGFSAGGDLALRLTFSETLAPEDASAVRPNFLALVYPGGCLPDARLVGPIPPVFLVHAADDSKVPVQVSLDIFSELKAAGGRPELHVYSKGEHGFALRSTGEVHSWPDLFRAWATEHGFLSAAPGR